MERSASSQSGDLIQLLVEADPRSLSIDLGPRRVTVEVRCLPSCTYVNLTAFCQLFEKQSSDFIGRWDSFNEGDKIVLPFKITMLALDKFVETLYKRCPELIIGHLKAIFTSSISSLSTQPSTAAPTTPQEVVHHVRPKCEALQREALRSA